MNDISPETREILFELRTPEEKLELALSVLYKEGQWFDDHGFDNEQEANEAGQEFVERGMQALSKVEGIDTIEVALEGEGVMVPALSVVPYEHDGESGIGVTLPGSGMVRSLQPLEIKRGTIERVYCTVRETDGVYKVGPVMQVSLNDIEKAVVAANDQLDLIQIAIIQRALVALDETSQAKVTELEKARHGYDLANRIALLGIARSQFMYQLNKLGQALTQEVSSQFIELRKPEIIRRIGAYGEAYARKGEVEASTVREAILGTMQTERTVFIDHLIELDEEVAMRTTVHGHIADVLMPESAEDDVAASLVIEAYDSDEDEMAISIVPFKQIATFTF